MRKNTFDYEPALVEHEGQVARINFDVETVTEPVAVMGDGDETQEREVHKAHVVRVAMPLAADDIRAAVVALGLSALKADVIAREVLFVQGGSKDLEQAKALVLARIAEYDSSDAVNEFTLDGETHWIPREIREITFARIAREEAKGIETTVLDSGDFHYEGPLVIAKTLLGAVEDYATACYDVTKAHERAVMAQESVADVLAYDYKSGYPEKLSLTLGAPSA